MQLKINNIWQKEAIISEIKTSLNIIEEFDRQRLKECESEFVDDYAYRQQQIAINGIIKNTLDLMSLFPRRIEDIKEKR